MKRGRTIKTRTELLEEHFLNVHPPLLGLDCSNVIYPRPFSVVKVPSVVLTYKKINGLHFLQSFVPREQRYWVVKIIGDARDDFVESNRDQSVCVVRVNIVVV